MISNVGCSSTQSDTMLSMNDTQLLRKKIVKFNRNGCPVGANATRFQNRVGSYVKTFVSIRYPDWRQVPKNYKDDVWNCILREFEVPKCARKFVQKSMPNALRKLKHSLRKKYLDTCPNLEAQKLNIPPRIDKDEWEQFCINENDEKQKQKRAQNVKNKKHSAYCHYGGRKSVAMLEEEMIEKENDPAVPIKRDGVLIETRTRKDRTTLPTAPFMEQVQTNVAEARHCESSSSSSVHPISIDDDHLNQVFPEKSTGALPGVGSHVTKSQHDASLPAHIMYSKETTDKEVIEKKFERMEKKLDFVVDFCNKLISQAQAAGGTSIPMISMMMNPTPGQFLSGMNLVTSPRNEPTPLPNLCELLDWDGNCVAVAKEVTDPMHRGNCHNYVLDPLLELKVSMVTRKMFHAKLYKAEKNPDAKTIGEVGVGDFFVWPKSHLRYIE